MKIIGKVNTLQYVIQYNCLLVYISDHITARCTPLAVFTGFAYGQKHSPLHLWILETITGPENSRSHIVSNVICNPLVIKNNIKGVLALYEILRVILEFRHFT